MRGHYNFLFVFVFVSGRLSRHAVLSLVTVCSRSSSKFVTRSHTLKTTCRPFKISFTIRKKTRVSASSVAATATADADTRDFFLIVTVAATAAAAAAAGGEAA